MNGKLLLDTNIVIAIFANDAAVMNSLADANEVFLPSIALGELYYGAHKSNRVAANTVHNERLQRSVHWSIIQDNLPALLKTANNLLQEHSSNQIPENEGEN